jgi:hypothetical protein
MYTLIRLIKARSYFSQGGGTLKAQGGFAISEKGRSPWARAPSGNSCGLNPSGSAGT